MQREAVPSTWPSRPSRSHDAAELHRSLSEFNERRLRPRLPDDASVSIEEELAMRLREESYLESERREIAAWASDAPQNPEAFVQWFDGLSGSGPGERDPLFPFLAEQASMEQMRWFLEQEVAGEAGFDDLVALTQVKFEGRAKLEMGNNYWDELGRGNEGGMHGPMLSRLARALELAPVRERIAWEALAVGNLMVGVATNRRYAYHAVGALGAIELTAPWRAAHVNAALKRLGVPGHQRQYYALHATLDVKHSRQWNDEVLAPLVASEPRAARALAEGALMRLATGARSFVRYRRELGLGD